MIHVYSTHNEEPSFVFMEKYVPTRFNVQIYTMTNDPLWQNSEGM